MYDKRIRILNLNYIGCIKKSGNVLFTYESTIIIIVDNSISLLFKSLVSLKKKKSEVPFNKVQLSESDIIADCFVIPKS